MSTDPLLQARSEIFDAFDRTVASSESASCNNLHDVFMMKVCGTHEGRFVSPITTSRQPRWSTAQVRHVLRAFLDAAPDAELRTMLRDARAFLRWLIAFEKRAHIERMVEGPLHNYLPVGEHEADRIARVEASS